MFVTAGVVTILFLLLGLRVLMVGHPNEDAYILFTYVQNYAASGGLDIHYSVGGGPTQGFVDLLWFLVLGQLALLGADPAVAACVISAVCAGGLAAVLVRVAPPGWPWRVLVAGFCLTFHGTVASLGGFGTLFFCLATSLAYAALRFDWPRVRLLLVILLPAVRLEGIACAAMLGWLHFGRDRTARNAVITFACFGLPLLIAGQWRGIYFGDAMPLPIYVKSDGLSVLPGLVSNLKWAYRETGPLPFVLLSLVAMRVGRVAPAVLRPLLVAALPALAVLAPLLLAEQIQNVRWRYQAPATLACVFVFLEIVGRLPSRRTGFVLGVLACAATFGLGTKHVLRLLDGQPRLHAHRFVPSIAPLLPLQSARVGTTEAGIVAFWLRCDVTDIIGLNDAYFAASPVQAEDLGQFDVLVFNTYGVIDAESIPFDDVGLARLAPRTLRLAKRNGKPSRLEAAAEQCVRFLQGSDRVVWAVREGRNVLVWAFAPGLSNLGEIEKRFRAAADPGTHRGYLDTIRGGR